MTELDSEGVVSVWWSITIGAVLIVLALCWSHLNSKPIALCANACGSAGVARVTATDCVCREVE
jgi:hypothetical protein